MFGIDAKGFIRKRQIDLVDSMNSTARSLFGQNVNLNENSPLGMIIKIFSFGMAILWQLAESVYYSAYKDTAEGYQLDGVGQYIGIKRLAATYATGMATFTGDAGTIIPLRFIIQSEEGVQFWTDLTGTIPLSGTIDLPIRALVLGQSGNLLADTITKILNPLTGLTSVTNATATTGGEEVESDDDFRKRYDRSISEGGASTLSSIQAELLKTLNVVDASVIENVTMVTSGGVPAKSIHSIVYGGTDINVATAIYNTKPAGIQAYGTTVVPITDDYGMVHNIGFTRVATVPIYVKADLTTDPEFFPIGGESTIQTAIIKYIGGIDQDYTEYYGLGLGDDVVYTKIIGLCHSVAGVTDVAVTLSLDNITFTATNKAISPGQVAVTDYNKVTFL